MGSFFQPMHLLVFGVMFGLILPLLAGALLVVPCWRIFKKAGFPGPLALLMLVPVVGVVALYVVAFSRWKLGAETHDRAAPYSSSNEPASSIG